MGIDRIELPLDGVGYSTGVAMLKFYTSAAAAEARHFLDHREVQEGSGLFVRVRIDMTIL